ncbi:MAG TPA: ATP-binding protein [Fimbriimonas sp.]|nr:ATP-binding protein [Fimbriimonas sp.]
MFTRAAEAEIRDSLADTPVVLIHGPRQSGKSTLAQAIGKQIAATYVTLDDPTPRSLALRDPDALLQGYSGPLILDEVQRAPQLFLALKAAVDRDRRPGKFLLTGSANVLALPKIADSLAGRIAIIDLLPLSQAEIEGKQSTFIDRLFVEEPLACEAGGEDLPARIAKGGFPEPYLRASAARRDAWFADYTRTLLERDVRDLANIEGLAQMPKLLRLLAARSGSALNVVDLAAETQIPNTSLHRYLDLLKAVFLATQVPAWSADQAARLTKTPKTFLVDSGLLCHLRGVTEANLAKDPDLFLSVLRNFVAMELKKLCSASALRPALHHLRTMKRLEVDFVLEARGGDLVGIQVKAGSTVTDYDVEGLQFLEELAGENFRRGILLYGGSEVQPIGRRMTAAPVSALWNL